MHQAQDTFVADLDDGTVMRVVKGDYLPDSHPLVRRDADGSGTLFKQAYLSEDETPKPAVKPAAKRGGA
jgi:hypothetical protein